MQLVYFETTRPDHDQDDIHRKVIADMRVLAESLDGFVMWRDVDEGLEYWGVVMFETEAGAIAWRCWSMRRRRQGQSRGTLYSAFKTHAFDSVRSNSYDGD